MSKKFTEEQYQKIVEVGEKYRNDRRQRTQSVLSYVWDNGLMRTGDERQLDIALTLANPLTREWAHDKFVEKEKRFYWTSKKQDEQGYSTRIMKDNDGLVRTYPIDDRTEHAEDEQLTESEVKSWGYNPEMFDKEEV